MTKNEIIEDLFKSKDFNDCISKMKPEHLQDDLRSEVILILCEKSEEAIISLHAKGALRFYAVRIILNLIQSNTSPFYKKFRQDSIDLTTWYGAHVDNLDYPYYAYMDADHVKIKKMKSIDLDYDKDESINKKILEDFAINEIDGLYWYDKEIVKLYLKLGNYRAIETETGIPWESVYKTVQKACKKIREKISEDNKPRIEALKELQHRIDSKVA